MWKIQRLVFLFIFFACRGSDQHAKRCPARSGPGPLRRWRSRPPGRAGQPPPRPAAPAAPRRAPAGGPGHGPAAGAVRERGAGRAAGCCEPRAHLRCELALSLLHTTTPPPFFFPSLSLFFSYLGVFSKEGVVQPGGKRGGEVGRRGTGAADGSPACGQAQRDPPAAGTARGNAAGAPGGVTGGRPRGWPRPAGRHRGPAPRAAPRRLRGRCFDSALAARSPGPPSTWGRFYAFVPTLLPPVCLPRVAGCPAASRSPRRGEPRAAAASPERSPARTGGAGREPRVPAVTSRRLCADPSVTGHGSVPVAMGARPCPRSEPALGAARGLRPPGSSAEPPACRGRGRRPGREEDPGSSLREFTRI
ncbi:uncharacterized protein LOC141730664 [Zonotrichia albicollis]|uniref:uncharacterized protein LOC141730664 n=1 Tax=Zonotrichia albicollis TaxID=44394 RepID=UPI003D8122DA